MQVQVAADQLFFSTVYVHGSGGGKEWTGTGFAYAVQTDKGLTSFWSATSMCW